MKTPPHNSITLISDSHGKLAAYHKIIRQTQKYPYTIQLGDFTMGHNSLKTLDNVDHLHHLIIPGNHDQYNKLGDYPHFLGDFGYKTFNGVSFFWYRGAYSIDKMYRTVGHTWFQEEEVSREQFEKAKELYAQVKPDIFLAHTCPYKVADLLLEPWQQKFNSFTEYALQELVDIHEPKWFYHGHFHLSRVNKVGRTKYVCLAELETVTINQNGDPVICTYCGIQYDKGNCDCGNQWI
jgi:predicted phosphodiesterase